MSGSLCQGVSTKGGALHQVLRPEAIGGMQVSGLFIAFILGDMFSQSCPNTRAHSLGLSHAVFIWAF